MLLRVGSAEVGGLIEVVEWDPPCELAWTSVTGLDQRGRWRLRELPGDRTRVELRLAYGVAGAGPRAGSPSASPPRRSPAICAAASTSSRGWSSMTSCASGGRAAPHRAG